MLDVSWGGEQWRLLHERAVYWPRRRTLLAADLHLGKPAAFRAAGIPVPHSCPADLDRLASIIDQPRTAADRPRVERLVILGDLLHARSGRSGEVLGALHDWRQHFRTLDVLLIRGNHDDRAGDPPATLDFRVLNQPALDPDDAPFVFAHHPPTPDEDGPPTLCGHVHPALRLEGSVSAMRLPCFWITRRAMIFPSFGSFTGAKVVRPREGDRLFAVGPNAVVEAPTSVRPSPLPR